MQFRMQISTCYLLIVAFSGWLRYYWIDELAIVLVLILLSWETSNTSINTSEAICYSHSHSQRSEVHRIDRKCRAMGRPHANTVCSDHLKATADNCEYGVAPASVEHGILFASIMRILPIERIIIHSEQVGASILGMYLIRILFVLAMYQLRCLLCALARVHVKYSIAICSMWCRTRNYSCTIRRRCGANIQINRIACPDLW